MQFENGDRVIAIEKLWSGVRKGDRGVVLNVSYGFFSSTATLTISFDGKHLENVSSDKVEKI